MVSAQNRHNSESHFGAKKFQIVKSTLFCKVCYFLVSGIKITKKLPGPPVVIWVTPPNSNGRTIPLTWTVTRVARVCAEHHEVRKTTGGFLFFVKCIVSVRACWLNHDQNYQPLFNTCISGTSLQFLKLRNKKNICFFFNINVKWCRNLLDKIKKEPSLEK